MPGTGDAQDVQFGVDRYVDALLDRLREHFKSSAVPRVDGDGRATRGAARGDHALVAGILGPWGCGKTTWLRRIEAKVLEEAAEGKVVRTVDPTNNIGQATIPVFFNAWKYEREPHMIVPLLKTAQSSMRSFASQHATALGADPNPREPGLLARSLEMLDDLIFAVASGSKLEAGVGPFKAGLDGGKAVEAHYRRKKERAAAKNGVASPVDAYESIYYDLLGYMRALTRPSTLPQLWDWLDQAPDLQLANKLEAQLASSRRDPEPAHWGQRRRRKQDDKKIEEKIKELRGSPSSLQLTDGKAKPRLQINLLFLIDDLDRCLPEKAVEVLESIKLCLEAPGCAFVLGIDDEVIEHAIRQRYKDYRRGEDQLIAGPEYLEKLIQLPVRVPPLSRPEARRFLEAEYGYVFERRSEFRAKREQSGKTAPTGDKLSAKSERRDPRQDVLDLIANVVPSVPRKLIRAAELFSLLDTLGSNGPTATDYDPVLLARLVILQLFAPAVFRLGQRHEFRELMRYLWELRSADLSNKPEANSVRLEEDGDDLRVITDRRVKVAKAVYGVLNERVGFDARAVLEGLDSDSGLGWDAGVRAHYCLVGEGAATIPDLVDAPAVLEREAVPRLPVARLRDPQTFVSLATINLARAWQEAVSSEEEALSGAVLGPAVVDALRKALDTDSGWFSREWLETFLPLLSLQAVESLFRASDLLDRTASTDASAALGLLTVLCRHFNPPHAPSSHCLGVERLRSDHHEEPLDLLAASMWDAYLVGLSETSDEHGE